MLALLKVTDESFNSVYKKMEDAFPYEERRCLIDQKKCLSDSRFEFYEIVDGSSKIGFVAIWNLSSFIFIEHIAIDKAQRGKGYGSKALDLLKLKYNKDIILEAEAPVTSTQIKRIAFYEKAGFIINNYYYEQPSYHNEAPVPLKLLSYPSALSEDEFLNFVNETKISAYAL